MTAYAVTRIQNVNKKGKILLNDIDKTHVLRIKGL